MPYQHRSTDSLMGDEPEIDALANRAEAMRDVDAEIDRKLERYEALDPATLNDAVTIQQTAIKLIRRLSEMAEWPISVSKRDADLMMHDAKNLYDAVREMAK